jgi:copper transport protein
MKEKPMSMYRYIKTLPIVLIILLLTLTLGLTTRTASAHAALVQATPAANSHLQESPPLVSVTFNERLDEGLFYLKVIDQKGSAVTQQAAAMNAEHTGLELPLPKLSEGIYVISYHVISGDGHPISGSYPITIGNPPVSDHDGHAAEPAEHQHGDMQSISVSMLVQYASRGLWFFSMLALAGWVMWQRLPAAGGAAARQLLASWTQNLQRVHFVALLIMIFTHMEDLLGNGGVSELVQLFTGTGVGLSWSGLLVVSLLGFAVLQRWVWGDILWALALLAVKSSSGHAAAFPPQAVSIVLDFIHLVAAALWIGGLLLLAVQWRLKQENTTPLLEAFSKMALISIIVLTISGSASVLLFLPNLKYVFYSVWGILMLVKIALVVLVIVVAVFLRRAMRKRREQQIRRWFNIDFALMIAIVLLVGCITYMAPIPANEPLKWHVMGETMHMSAEITPKTQGANTFVVKVWLPEKAGKPKQVQMILHYEDDKQIPPIEVPLMAFSDQTEEESYGFAKTSYKAEGAYLPLRGKWSLEVRVMDPEDNETPYQKDFMVY